MDADPRSLPPQKTLRAHVLTEYEMNRHRVLIDFWRFLKQEKKYWLIPLVIVFALFGLLMSVAQSTASAPFIYTLF